MCWLCHNPSRSAALGAFVTAVQRVMDLRRREGLSGRRQTIEVVSLEDALRRADFVSLHLPLTMPGTAAEPTFHLIDEARLRLMKPTAYLVNTARGPVVDERALARALREGWIAGAALDVFEEEPLPERQPAAGRGAPPEASALACCRSAPIPFRA